MSETTNHHEATIDTGRAFQSVFLIFLRLGCMSFGGPAAHLGYFRRAFVEQRRWLTDQEYGALVALSQFLPGPGSSQVGFALGMQRAGITGGLAAFLGFTLPSFLLMLALAVATSWSGVETLFYGLTQGLKLLALVVVADACLGMFRSFCQQTLTRLMALAALLILLLGSAGAATQLLLLLSAGAVGWLLLKNPTPEATPVKVTARLWPLLLTLAGVLLLLTAGYLTEHDAASPDSLAVFLTFFQAGSLVFGGGHVVLPLLEAPMQLYMTAERFLAGYSLAQAVPGPMFTLAGFLGAEIGLQGSGSLLAALIMALVATLAVFLPGLLLMATLLPHWQAVSSRPALMAAVKGINAAVVGFLLQALVVMGLLILVQPYLELSAETLPQQLLTGLLPDLLLILLGWLALKRFRLPIVWLVAGFALAGVLRGWMFA